MPSAPVETALAAKLLKILKELNKPIDCVCLARLVGIQDSSAVYRLMMNSPGVAHIHSHGLTTFTFREEP